MRKNALFALGLAVMLAVVAVTTAGGQAAAQETDYVVLYKDGASLASARQAVRAAGGAILSENTDVGVATVRTTNENFLTAVAGQSALAGAAHNTARRLRRAGPARRTASWSRSSARRSGRP